MKHKTQKILVTGCSGFIGMHVVLKLLAEDHEIVGIDNLNDYYDVNLKKDRLKKIINADLDKKFKFVELDMSKKSNIFDLFEREKFNGIINLGAQAGVRYSIVNPDSYISSNIVGFFNILEACRKYLPNGHIVFASSSSVYGLNENLPFSEKHSTDHSLSLYAATKKSNEVFAHAYANMYGLKLTGLRFFTVYGPWGRPDMALFIFTKAILENKPIKLFNHGNMIRDFTYIDDIVIAIIKVYMKPDCPDLNFDKKNPSLSSSTNNYRIFNIGNGKPVKLNKYISAIEKELGIKARKEYLPIQKGDVISTAADTDVLNSWISFRPKIIVDEGIKHFISWYRKYYNV